MEGISLEQKLFKESWSTTMLPMRAFVYVSVTLWARGSHFVWPRKWRQQLIKVTGKRKQKRALHCG
jgi:hypothetical protein